MKKIAIIVNYSWAGVSSPLINSVYFLINKGYYVDIYLDRPNTKQFPIPDFNKNKNINIFIFRGLGRGIIGDIYFFLSGIWWWKAYDVIIAYDFQAIFRGAIIKWFSNAELIYHNLEFLTVNDFQSRVLKIRERFACRFAKYIITQDIIRAKWLSKNLKQPIEKFKIVYNSSRGNEVKISTTSYFRNKFKIPGSTKIVLVIGSLIKEHLIPEIVNSALNWDDSKVLILHGWFPDSEIYIGLVKIQKDYPGKFYFSEELFSDEDKYVPYASCDIGFVGYCNKSLNHNFAGGASGKLFDFIKVGKPILAYDTPGIFQIIENNKVGFTFNNFNEIGFALDEILENYSSYSDNCILSYQKFEFDSCYNSFWKFIV
uniref:hypothetical protein n=1 Tax=Algoriphagus sp. TaxID=1872435 RepID=UPI004047B9EB